MPPGLYNTHGLGRNFDEYGWAAGDLRHRTAWTTSAAASVTSPATESGRV